ncbi:MAG TPA: hypothetical protein VLE53_13260 [Gemmatimonadaceae bacterium]|nr:hypothetical protein [Gemmatimonadaceae bacterium]
MRGKRLWLSLVLVGSLSACYHQTVQTGLSPGATVVDLPWVQTWIFGLVAPDDIDVRSQCPSGTAMVETERSFLNGLVGAVTIGIYTPVHVRITCASGSAALPVNGRTFVLPADASAEQETQLLRAAVQASLAQDQAIIVRF